MLKDIRYAFRALRQNSGFALTAILSIALAIGANSTIFSLANGLLLRPLSVPQPNEFVTLRAIGPAVSSSNLKGIYESSLSYPEYEDFRRSTHSFFGLVAMDHIIAAFAKDAKTPVEFILGNRLDGDAFRTMRVTPQLGRFFTPEDDRPGTDPVMVLSHDLWRDEFGEDKSVVGRRVLLNNLPFTVIGVSPESFTGLDPFTHASYYIPIATGPRLYADLEPLRTDRSRRAFVVKGRLNPGVSVSAAAQEVAAIMQSLAQIYPDTNRGYRATVSTEFATKLAALPIIGDLTAALFIIAVVVLIIACANVANLMLSRGRVRAREIAVRLALGASRGRLIRLLLIESLVIALAGGILAVFAARVAAGVFSRIQIPSDMPLYLDTHVDSGVILFTAAVAVGSALIFGLLPAFHSTRPDLVAAMKTGEADDPRRAFFGRYALIALQIAGTMILLVLTMQGRKNFKDLLGSSPGFRRDHRITMRFDPLAAGYSQPQTEKFYERLVERATEVLGVKSAAMTSGLPMTYDPERREIAPEHYDFPPGKEAARVLTYTVDEHYFDTFAVPILIGRAFRATDRADTPQVVIVNQAFAEEFLPGNPIGKRVRIKNPFRGTDLMAEVVGVAVTGKTFLLTEPPIQAIYLPMRQNFHERMTLIAETAGDPTASVGPLEEMVRSIDPNMPVYRVRTMDDIFNGSSVAIVQTVLRIYDVAAVMGLGLALVGLYAVVAYQVARRTREIGIRMALGAERIHVLKLFLSQALIVTIGGIVAGLMLSGFANRLSATALGSADLDPRLVAAVAVSLLVAGAAAALIPARTACRIDPQQALRQD